MGVDTMKFKSHHLVYLFIGFISVVIAINYQINTNKIMKDQGHYAQNSHINNIKKQIKLYDNQVIEKLPNFKK